MWGIMVKSGENALNLQQIKCTMISLQGEHIGRVDVKGRFQLPVALKNQLSAVLNEGFVVKRSIFNQCLELYPKSNWDELIRKITSKLNMFRRQDNDFLRAYTAGLKQLEIDNTGRILIPRDLAVFAEITGDIVVAAKMNCIEIWEKGKYDEIVSATQANIPDIAEQLLGDININE
jgi:MraZ protein